MTIRPAHVDDTNRCAPWRLNIELGEVLDVDDFFFSVRPYYKPYRLGSRAYRGANAGDFAAFNRIDLLLGLCSPNDPSYIQTVLEKMPYLVPAEQQQLNDAFRHPNLLDSLLDNSAMSNETWFRENAAAFLDMCAVHGTVAAQHHDELVTRFVQQRAERIPAEHLEGLTASGPPLDVMLRALEGLSDRRLLPIHADGALFSIGDCHSAQGDGEVCGTGVESPMTATIKLSVRRGLDVAEFQARRRTRPALSDSEVHITTAHGPDLYENARNATHYMIEWLGTNRGLEPADAYLLCSTAADLRTSEIVDVPNWIVSLHFPLDIFR